MTADDLAAVAALALRHDILVVSDEIYSRNVYGAPFASIAQVPACKNARSSSTVLQSYAMTGWRLGYCIAPKAIVHALTLFANNTYQCVATFTQKAASRRCAATTAP